MKSPIAQRQQIHVPVDLFFIFRYPAGEVLRKLRDEHDKIKISTKCPRENAVGTQRRAEYFRVIDLTNRKTLFRDKIQKLTSQASLDLDLEQRESSRLHPTQTTRVQAIQLDRSTAKKTLKLTVRAFLQTTKISPQFSRTTATTRRLAV